MATREQDGAIPTVSCTIVITNRYGLHARPAALFVELCNRFRSDIFLIKRDMEVNAKNILDIMTLGAGKGTTLTLRATGEDAEAAAQALLDLVESNFGEEADS